MKQDVTIGMVMTPSPVTIDINSSLAEAKHTLQEVGSRHLPVMDKGHVVSVMTDRDINLALAATKELQRAEDIRVEEVCTLHTFMVGPDETVESVVTQMAIQHIGSALIADNDQLVGIFTVTDACRLLGSCLRDEPIDPTAS